jgi:hypothetical protein
MAPRHAAAQPFWGEVPVWRAFLLAGLSTFVLNLISERPDPVQLRPDLSREALISLGQEYSDLQQWVAAVAAATDTLSAQDSERSRVLAEQLARLIRPLERDFEETTAALSTDQLELVLPLWERMAFAHAGLVMLQEEAAALGGDPALQPAELRELVVQLSAVLDFAAEIQGLLLAELTAPIPSSIRIT